MLYGLTASIISIYFLVFVLDMSYNFLFPEVDYHDVHVTECEKCHERNLSYGLVSGFCLDGDIDGIYAYNLTRDCNEIPHGSVLGTRRFII